MNMVVETWMFVAEHGDFAEIKVRSQNGEEMSDVELRRLDSQVMANYVMLDWTFRGLSANSSEMNQVKKVQLLNRVALGVYAVVRAGQGVPGIRCPSPDPRS